MDLQQIKMLCSLTLSDNSFQILLKDKVAEQLSIGVFGCFFAAYQKLESVINFETNRFQVHNFSLDEGYTSLHWPCLRNIKVMDDPSWMYQNTIIDIRGVEPWLFLFNWFRSKLFLSLHEDQHHSISIILCNPGIFLLQRLLLRWLWHVTCEDGLIRSIDHAIRSHFDS